MEQLAHISLEGIAAQKARVLASSASSALWARQFFKDQGMDVPVQSVRQFIWQVLASNDALAETRRRPRIALPLEIQVLSEDLLERGFGTQAVRAALQSRVDTSGDTSSEVREAASALQELLETYQLMLTWEAPQLAAKYLGTHTTCPVVPEQGMCVYDFDNMTRSEQSICVQLGACALEPGTESSAGDERSFELVKWARPTDEREHVSALVAGILEANASLVPGDIVVVVPYASWAKELKKYLAHRGLATVGDTTMHPLLKNPQENATAVRTHIALLLATDAADPLAARLRQAYLPQGEVRDLSPLRGTSLLSAAAGPLSAEFAEVLGPLEETEDAAQLCDMLRIQAHDRSFETPSRKIKLLTYAAMASASPKIVFLLACVDGLVPRTGRALPTKEQFVHVARSGRLKSFISYFQKCPLAEAEALQLQVARVKSEQGQQLAMTKLSPFVESVSSELPGSISGAELLARKPLL